MAEAATGLILRAEEPFLALLQQEWRQFDGDTLPHAITSAWAQSDRITYIGKRCRIDGRRSQELAYLFARARAASEQLSQRQLDVARLYAGGMPSKRIAQLHNLSPATVRNHLAAVYSNLGIHGKAELLQKLESLQLSR